MHDNKIEDVEKFHNSESESYRRFSDGLTL